MVSLLQPNETFDVYLVCCLRASDTEELPPGLCSSSQFWGVCLALVYLRKGQFIIYGRGQGVCQTGLAQKCPQAACPKNICFRSVPWHGNLSNEFIQLFVICVMESSDERERNPGDDLSLILNGKNIYWTYKKLPPVIITQPWNTSCVWHPITVIHLRRSGARAINKANQNEAVKWVV